jgi:hypothetical protein
MKLEILDDESTRGVDGAEYLIMEFKKGDYRRLPADQKLRAISISMSILPQPGSGEFLHAVQEANAAGVLVFYGAEEFLPIQHAVFGLARPVLSNPEKWDSYELPPFYQRGLTSTSRIADRRIFVPMDERTTASPTGDSDYVYYGDAGISWALPYMAGISALAAQVDSSLTPERFWDLAVATGHPLLITAKNGQKVTSGRILNPPVLMEEIRRRKSHEGEKGSGS